MALTRGYTFDATEEVTAQKLHQLVEDAVPGAGSILLSMLADGILSADSAGRAKMASGYITTAKLADAVLSADSGGRAKMADGFVTTAKLADAVLSADAAGLAKVADGFLSADAAGRGKMADEYVTLVKLVQGILANSSAGRARMADGFLSADAEGRAKMADGFLTQAKLDAAVVARLAREYILVTHEETSGTNGTVISDGSWVQQPWNTVKTDESGSASVASNRISLPAGDYNCRIVRPNYILVDDSGEGLHLWNMRLRDITNSVNLAFGTPASMGNSGNNFYYTDSSMIAGSFTLAATAELEVQIFVRDTTGAVEQIRQAAAAVSGVPEVFGIAEFFRRAT